MSRRVVHDPKGALRLHFPFDHSLIRAIKSLPERRWNGYERYWSVPDTNVVAVVDLLFPRAFALCDTTRRLYVAQGGTLDLDAPPLVAAIDPAEQLSFEDEPEGIASSRSPRHLTVSRLNQEVQALIRAALPERIWLVGEVAGFTKNERKKIVDFHLVERDPEGQVVAKVSATLFEDARWEIGQQLREADYPFELEDEIEIRVLGRVDLYIPWGSYRFVIDELDVSFTIGEAARRREEVRRLLIEEGILERNRSLSVPPLPLRVGLITSEGSDAYNDVVQTLRSSGFAFRIAAYDVRVQGRQTEPCVLKALDWFRAHAASFDVLLICRGGGSRTDLAWFDSLPLARGVALSPLPVLIGIGHERDFSALDFIGRSHKTPTAAAEWLVHEARKVSDHLERRLEAILEGAQDLVSDASAEISELSSQISRATTSVVKHRDSSLRDATRRLEQGARRELSAESYRIEQAAARIGPRSLRLCLREEERVEFRRQKLALVEPRRVVNRGYAILRLGSGQPITDPSRAPQGTQLVAELRGGALRLRSEGAEKEP